MVKPTMRAKMVVQNITEHVDEKSKKAKKKKLVVQTDLEMSAVCGDFDKDGHDENNSFARYTPMADLLMTIQNPGLHGVFKEGDELYVDFTFCKEHE